MKVYAGAIRHRERLTEAAQQMVEKSLKVALALGGVDFPMMAHDLDFLLTLAADNDIEIPAGLTGATWLTAWGTTYENGETSPGSLDRQDTIAIGANAVAWCRNLVAEGASASDEAGAGSFAATRKHLGTEPGTLADFEAEFGPVRRPDGEG